jgi:hypothetical protein
MTLTRDPATGMFLKVCPHCGQASSSLGSQCRLCDHTYDPEPPGVMDQLPLLDLDDLPTFGSRAVGIVMVGMVVNFAIILTLGPPLALFKAVRRWVRAWRGS